MQPLRHVTDEKSDFSRVVLTTSRLSADVSVSPFLTKHPPQNNNTRL